MNFTRWRVLGWLLVVLAACSPSLAWAQLPPDGARVQEAIEQTERRIEQAEAIAGPGPAQPVQAEIIMARQLQVRARNDYSAGQFGMAGRATMEARGHADRAIAQVRGLPDPERVALQIERTRDGLDRVRERLGDCGEPRVAAMVRVATDMQGRAEAALEESRYLAALQLTMSARERVLKALRICRLEDSMQEGASRALQRTDEVLARARDAVERGAGDPIARQGLGRALSTQAEAQDEFANGRYESSLKLTQAARVGAYRVLRHGARPPGPPRR